MDKDIIFAIGFFLVVILVGGIIRGDMFSLTFVVAAGKFLAGIVVMGIVSFFVGLASWRARGVKVQLRQERLDRWLEANPAPTFPPRSLSVESVSADIFHSQLLQDTYDRVQALPRTPMQRVLMWLCPRTMHLMGESIRYACADAWRLLHEGDTPEHRTASIARSCHRARYMAKEYPPSYRLGYKRALVVLIALMWGLVWWLQSRPVP